MLASTAFLLLLCTAATIAQCPQQRSDHDIWREVNEADGKLKAPPKDDEGEYVYANITNAYDYPLRNELDRLDRLRENVDELRRVRTDYGEQGAKALARILVYQYDTLRTAHKLSPRATFGHARSLELASTLDRDRDMLAEAADVYEHAMEEPDVPPALMHVMYERRADALIYLGRYDEAIVLLRVALAEAPDDYEALQSLGLALVLTEQYDEATLTHKKVLKIDPTNQDALKQLKVIKEIEEEKAA